MSEVVIDHLVVDASLALKWVLEEPYTSVARALLVRWGRQRIRLLVPGWFACEIANVLYQRVRRGDLVPGTARLALSGVMTEVFVRDVEPQTAERSLDLAYALGRPTTYDTQYAALAEREHCELWTADERFWNVAHGPFPWIRWIGEPQALSSEG